MRLRRSLARSTLGAVAVLAVACGSSGSSAVSAGNGSPGAAAVGFLSNFTTRSAAACRYVTPAEQTVCNQAIAQAVKLTVTNLKVGHTSVSGNQALVTVLGTLCGAGTGTARRCFTSSQPAGGQPASPADFAKTFAAVQAGTAGTQNPAIPCVRTAGKWFVELGST